MNKEEDLRKWRLILGGQQNEGTGFSLDPNDLNMDKTLEALYDSNKQGWTWAVLAECQSLAGRYPDLFSVECRASDAAGCAEASEPHANAF